MMGAKDFTEISVKKGVWHFGWREYDGEHELWEEKTMVSGAQPRRELVNAMVIMSGCAADIMDIHEHEGDPFRRISINAVKIKYTDANWHMTMSGVLYTKTWYKKSEVWRTVPIKVYTLCDVETTNMEDTVASEDIRDAMNNLCECAERYIAGERADSEPPEAQDEPDPDYDMEGNGGGANE